jgi:subfamily B ATP-binding cassette protein MsbA
MNDYFKDVSRSEWKNDLFTVWLLTKKHLPRLIIAVISGLILSGINGAIAWLIKPSVDGLFAEKNRTLLVFLPFGIFLLFAVRGAVSFCNDYLMSSIGAKIVRSLRQAIYEKLLRMPMSFFSQKISGSIISRVLNDIGSLEGLIAPTARNFLVQLSTVIVLAFVALYRRWDLALVSFIIVPAVILVADRFGKQMKKTSANTRKLVSNVTRTVQETLLGIRVIKSFTMERAMRDRSDHAVSEHYRNVMREVRIIQFADSFMEIIGGVGMAIILWYGSYLILNNKMAIGEFFSFVVAVLMMYDPLKRLSRVNNSFQMIRASLHRIKEIFLIEDERTGVIKKKDISGHIVYEHVSFTYPGSSEPAIDDLSIDIRPGETVAFVGHSGAGKSTIVDLLLGFWQAGSGRILVDGVDLREYSMSSLRSHVGFVSQDIILFDDSVRNNILFGKPEAPDEEVLRASEAAYAHEFISDMPLGYDTQIGERGIKLSGGQKQRLSLARAIIRDPKILILDEATSSLDSDSETKIQKALESILPGRTTIIIAHRLSTVKKADRIIVIERGRIIQEGKHDELSNRAGVYRELYDMQLGMSGD